MNEGDTQNPDLSEEEVAAGIEAVEVDDGYAEEPTGNSFNWQASEYIHHEKKPTWYILFYGIVFALILGAFLLQQWFSIVVFVAMAGAMTVYANKTPRVLNYSINAAGITIENKFYPFTKFRSYSVLNDVAWHAIDLEPTERFMPRLTILLDSDDIDKVMAILQNELPRSDRQPDIVERISRSIKF